MLDPNQYMIKEKYIEPFWEGHLVESEGCEMVKYWTKVCYGMSIWNKWRSISCHDAVAKELPFSSTALWNVVKGYIDIHSSIDIWIILSIRLSVNMLISVRPRYVLAIQDLTELR